MLSQKLLPREPDRSSMISGSVGIGYVETSLIHLIGPFLLPIGIESRHFFTIDSFISGG